MNRHLINYIPHHRLPADLVIENEEMVEIHCRLESNNFLYYRDYLLSWYLIVDRRELDSGDG